MDNQVKTTEQRFYILFPKSTKRARTTGRETFTWADVPRAISRTVTTTTMMTAKNFWIWVRASKPSKRRRRFECCVVIAADDLEMNTGIWGFCG